MPTETRRILIEVPPGQSPVTVIEFATNETESGFVYQVRQGGRTVGTTADLREADALAQALLAVPAEAGAEGVLPGALLSAWETPA